MNRDGVEGKQRFSCLRNSYNYDIFTFAVTLIERMPVACKSIFASRCKS
jgi:hypothetical protein